MASRHPGSASQALYRIFVQPLLSTSTPRLPIAQGLLPQRIPSLHIRSAPPRPNTRAFSSATSPLLAAYRPPVARHAQDDEIKARRIYLVDSATGRLDDRLYYTRDVLRRVDRRTHKLVQVNDDSAAEGQPPNGIPVCKIVNKKDEIDAMRRRQVASKDSRRANHLATSVKTLEINWAIGAGDLEHRLEKMAAFLDAGRKVEVILANKKKSRRATSEECQDVLDRIQKAVEGVTGAKRLGTQGEVGKMYSVLIQGKPIKVSKKEEADGKDEADANAGPSNGDEAATSQVAQASTGSG